MMIYLFTEIGLPPGGSCTIHIYTQTIHRTTQNKQYTEQHKNFEINTKILKECGPCPDLASYTLAFALQLRKNEYQYTVNRTCFGNRVGPLLQIKITSYNNKTYSVRPDKET